MSQTHIPTTEITIGTVRSADGTTIGYRQLGNGPARTTWFGAPSAG